MTARFEGAKVHLILVGNLLCATRRREPGRLAVLTPKEFHTLDGSDEQCAKCAAKLATMEAWRAKR